MYIVLQFLSQFSMKSRSSVGEKGAVLSRPDLWMGVIPRPPTSVHGTLFTCLVSEVSPPLAAASLNSQCLLLTNSCFPFLYSSCCVSSTNSTNGKPVSKPSAKQCPPSLSYSVPSHPTVVSSLNDSKHSISTGHSNTATKSTKPSSQISLSWYPSSTTMKSKFVIRICLWRLNPSGRNFQKTSRG